MTDIDAFYRRTLILEARKRNRKRMQAIEILRANFVFHPRIAIGRGKVYDLLSVQLGIPNGNPFKRWLTEVLMSEFGVRPVCCEHDYLFRGMSDQAGSDAYWERYERWQHNLHSARDKYNKERKRQRLLRELKELG